MPKVTVYKVALWTNLRETKQSDYCGKKNKDGQRERESMKDQIWKVRKHLKTKGVCNIQCNFLPFFGNWQTGQQTV